MHQDTLYDGKVPGELNKKILIAAYVDIFVPTIWHEQCDAKCTKTTLHIRTILPLFY